MLGSTTNDYGPIKNSWVNTLGTVVTRFIEKCGAVFANITSFGIIVMIIIGTIDVIGSKLFNTPLPATYEGTEALMVIVTFGGLAFVQQKKSNIKVDVLYSHFSPKLQIISELAGNVIGLVFFCVFTWYAVLLFEDSYEMKEITEAVISFPIYPSKFMMLLGVGLLSIQLFIDTVQTTIRLFAKDPGQAKAQ